MAATYLFRAFADLFPSRSAVTQASHVPPATAAPSEAQPIAQPREIGTGAPNETFVTIGGVLHLFVDEGDCVAQFKPAFEETPCETRFGTKILPELAPYWSLLREHRAPLKEAIATAIRGNVGLTAAPPVQRDAAVPVAQEFQGEDETQHLPVRRRAAREHVQRGDDIRAATTGKVLGWGEEKFPNRKPTGRPFYTSFAMHIETAMGERTLQGEGLKDAIAQSGCRVGDSVSVRRLEKIKVPAFTDGGKPVMKNGQQVLWDKWLWSIKRR
ncbi:hypothetical protein LMG28688_06104 [Paraburkholderia caffeinitolerans]|uniref:Uncharacterized protein n=1 Tax=Paraburkholderia caffeinitolerans TaxID=1723730 RepID=A0A6J5GS94_9BURK|nr:hypothetical protein [Paraburkholderia caffeinitolerans]CAB3805076.1 hypothetical protein LMG28688_06104 [Paraburkholderia caffeinitolerans]